MAKKIIRPLRSEADYDAALNEIEQYFEKEPKPGTPEADRFDLLALIIEDYERKRWPIEPPDAIDAIRYRMDPKWRAPVDEDGHYSFAVSPPYNTRSFSAPRELFSIDVDNTTMPARAPRKELVHLHQSSENFAAVPERTLFRHATFPENLR